MRLGILGPLLLADGEVDYVPRQAKPRQLLALLVLHANEPVPIRTCLRELWDTRPPPTAVQTVQNYVMQLRRHGPPARLITCDSGYQFLAGPGELDVAAYAALVKAGQDATASGDNAAAADALAGALALWRGPALADVRTGPVVRARLAGLGESRLTTLEQRIEADLRLGRHERLVDELCSLVGRYPRNESLCAQAMLALYRSGRPGEAVARYRSLAGTLADEQGLTPSPRLRRLYRAILDRDRRLDAATSSGHR